MTYLRGGWRPPYLCLNAIGGSIHALESTSASIQSLMIIEIILLGWTNRRGGEQRGAHQICDIRLLRTRREVQDYQAKAPRLSHHRQPSPLSHFLSSSLIPLRLFDFLNVISRGDCHRRLRRAIEISGANPPAKIPWPVEKLIHPFNGNLGGLWHPHPEYHQT